MFKDHSQPLVQDSSTIAPSATSSAATRGSQNLDKYLLRDETTKAEILWCLQTVLNHTSLSSSAKSVGLFPVMFPDSKIASAMQLGRTKIAYTIVFGLAPYFHEILENEIKGCDCFVASFDESLNKSAQLQQMDIAVRFWSESKGEVHTSFFSSAFLGHAKAVDLLNAFKEQLSHLNLKHLLQVSMDGPNVNLKFQKDLKHDLNSGQDPDCPSIVFMGTCGLHIMNNSFKTAAKATNWGIVQFLRAIYNVFKDVPARRSDYTLYSGSTELPKKFCAVRWLCNAEVAQRALKILPNLKKFVEGVNRDKKEINSASYQTLVEGVNDKLMGPKLSFFSYVATEIEPFLTEFQSDSPMAPFLYTELVSVITTFMTMFVKDEVMKCGKPVQDIDLKKKENLLFSKNVHLGYDTRAALRGVQLSELEIALFKKECSVMLQTLCSKLFEKAPLKYKLCKGVTFCDPTVVAKSANVAFKRIQMALEVFQENNWISGNEADQIDREFRKVCSKPDVMESMRKYSRKQERVDHFWMSVISTSDDSTSLLKFLKKIFILSHGNAFVERGFSINKECIVENQSERSLVAQRQVYGGVHAAGGLDKLNLSIKMIQRARNARELYGEALEQKKLDKINQEKGEIEKMRVRDKLKELSAKRRKLIQDSQKEAEAIDEEMRLLGNVQK